MIEVGLFYDIIMVEYFINVNTALFYSFLGNTIIKNISKFEQSKIQNV